MVKASFPVSLLLAGCLATVLGGPVDLPISFSTTESPLQAAHNATVMSSVCVDMTPVHGNSAPQAEAAPYTLQVTQKTAAPGDIVQVKIQGRESEQFRGVYIQGRHGDIPVGLFVQPESGSSPVTFYDCPPGAQNAASYISKRPISELTLDYVVPADVPDIVFTATFVKSYSEFWVGVRSERLLVSKTGA